MPGSEVALSLSVDELPWESNEDMDDSNCDSDAGSAVPTDWHEAEFILKVKEQ